MNRRQRKKAFKKKYGMNPEQVAKIVGNFDWGYFANQLTKALMILPEAIEKFIEDNSELIEKLKEEINNDNP